MGALHGFAGVGLVRRVGSTLVKGHDHVSANAPLHVHDGFGRKKMAAPVDVRLKFNPIFSDFAPVLEAVDLEPPAVGQHGPGPGRERVKSARHFNDFGARPEVEVVGIAQDDVGFGVARQKVRT